MFGKDKKENSNEKVLYEGQPNIIVYSKSVFIAVIFLGFLFFLYSAGIQYIGNMQVYLIESSKLPMTRYFAIAIFVMIIIVIVYILLKLLAWTAIKYTITENRVIVEKGLILSKKNSMPFNTIQDVGRSQSILGKLFSVGTITLYSAYDGKDIELKDISNPKKIENIIFENMRTTHLRPHNLYGDSYDNSYDASYASHNYYGGYNNYNDSYQHRDFKPVRPNSDEKVHYNRMEDLDDLELVDVRERKRNLREIRRKANDSRRENYNNQPIDGPSSRQNRNSNYNQNYNNQNQNYNHRKYNNQKYNNPDYRNYNEGYDDYNNQSYSGHNQKNYGSNDYSRQNRGYSQGNSRNQYRNDSRNQYRNDSRNQYRNDSRSHYQDNSRAYENPQNDGAIKESYKRNPNKYFAKNYEKFHQDNLDAQNQNSRESFTEKINPFDSNEHYRGDDYISDEEFDNTINQAMANIDDNIKFQPSNNQRFDSRENYHDDFNSNSRLSSPNYNDFNSNSRVSTPNYNDYNSAYDNHGQNRHSNYANDYRQSDRPYDDYGQNRYSNDYRHSNRAFDDDYRYSNPNHKDDHRHSNYDYGDDYMQSNYDYEDDYRQSNSPARLNKQSSSDHKSSNGRFSFRNRNKNKHPQEGYNSYNNIEDNSHYEEPNRDKKKKNNEKNSDDLFEKHSRKFKRS